MVAEQLFETAAKMADGKAAVEELAVRCGWFYRSALKSTGNEQLAAALTQQFLQGLLATAISRNQVGGA